GAVGDKIVFAGVGKTDSELRYALDTGVFLFNVESDAELHALAEVAKVVARPAAVALRVNPDLPAQTHPQTDPRVKGRKVGFDSDRLLEVARGVAATPPVRVVGLHSHLGSPILSAEPYRQGVAKGLVLIEELRKQGHPLRLMNMGGGFGIHYRKQEALPASAFAEGIVPAGKEAKGKLVVGPGRVIVGEPGVLFSRGA